MLNFRVFGHIEKVFIVKSYKVLTPCKCSSKLLLVTDNFILSKRFLPALCDFVCDSVANNADVNGPLVCDTRDTKK